MDHKVDADGIRIPFYKRHSKYSRSQEVQFCPNCGDTAFRLIENRKLTKLCCRCGEKLEIAST